MYRNQSSLVSEKRDGDKQQVQQLTDNERQQVQQLTDNTARPLASRGKRVDSLAARTHISSGVCTRTHTPYVYTYKYMYADGMGMHAWMYGANLFPWNFSAGVVPNRAVFRGAGAVFRAGVFGGDGGRRAQQTTLRLALGGGNGAGSQVRGGRSIDLHTYMYSICRKVVGCVDFRPPARSLPNHVVLLAQQQQYLVLK